MADKKVFGLMTYQNGRAGWGREFDEQRFETREEYLQWLEEQRRLGIQQRRSYYDGTMYDEENQKCIDALAKQSDAPGTEKALARAMAMWTRKLPEHLRLHEYSTVIQEAVDFIANRLSNKFSVEVEDEAAKLVVDTALDNSPELAGTDDDDDLTVVNVMREAVKVGDTPVRLRWDPTVNKGEGSVWLEFWDSEAVEMRFKDDRPDQVEKVIVEQIDWRWDDKLGKTRAMKIRREWSVQTYIANQADVEAAVTAPGEEETAGVPPLGEFGVEPDFREECLEEVWLVNDGPEDDRLIDTIPWGVPFVPWWTIRGDRKSLRGTRGESLIPEQAMKTADRYNANEQVSWLIARYNSHANMVVTGDNALVMQQKSERLQKDVADVLLFPGATNAFAMTLPTDPHMIEHQRQVLLDGLYGTMGVTRVDQSSLEGLGNVTGYALEILNQKSSGTFSRVRQQLIRDWKKVLNLVLDCHVYWSAAAPEHQADQVLFDQEEEGAEEPPSYQDLDPESVFPDRAMEINIGTGYIVDDVKIRDDFTAKLITQREALRQRGMSDDAIDEMLDEQDEQRDLEAERNAIQFGTLGTEGTVTPPVEQATPRAKRETRVERAARLKEEQRKAKTSAGSTTGSTARGA